MLINYKIITKYYLFKFITCVYFIGGHPCAEVRGHLAKVGCLLPPLALGIEPG